MKLKKSDNTFILRLDKGEEIIENITSFCKKNEIKSGYFSGIGAVDMAELSHYSVKNRKYSSRVIEKPLEISNLSGNITTMNGECYIHAHVTLGDKNMNAFGGHLKMARISATAEIFITTINSIIERRFDMDTGLNLIE